MKQPRNSRHHLIPQHWVELLGNSNPENIRMLTERFHRAFHTIFQNREPHNQLDYLLAFNSSVLQSNVIKEIKNIILDESSYVYKDWLYRKLDLK